MCGSSSSLLFKFCFSFLVLYFSLFFFSFLFSFLHLFLTPPQPPAPTLWFLLCLFVCLFVCLVGWLVGCFFVRFKDPLVRSGHFELRGARVCVLEMLLSSSFGHQSIVIDFCLKNYSLSLSPLSLSLSLSPLSLSLSLSLQTRSCRTNIAYAHTNS